MISFVGVCVCVVEEVDSPFYFIFPGSWAFSWWRFMASPCPSPPLPPPASDSDLLLSFPLPDGVHTVGSQGRVFDSMRRPFCWKPWMGEILCLPSDQSDGEWSFSSSGAVVRRTVDPLTVVEQRTRRWVEELRRIHSYDASRDPEGWEEDADSDSTSGEEEEEEEDALPSQKKKKKKPSPLPPRPRPSSSSAPRPSGARSHDEALLEQAGFKVEYRPRPGGRLDVVVRGPDGTTYRSKAMALRTIVDTSEEQGAHDAE